VNYFQNRNVMAIVIDVPAQWIGDPAATVRAWATDARTQAYGDCLQWTGHLWPSL